jgi:hypothetical protein
MQRHWISKDTSRATGNAAKNICDFRTVKSPNPFAAAFPCKAGVHKVVQQVLGKSARGKVERKGKEMLRDLPPEK